MSSAAAESSCPTSAATAPQGSRTLTTFSVETADSMLAEGRPVLRLLPHADNIKAMRDASPREGVSRTVALYGSTHCGKSSIVSSLLGYPPYKVHLQSSSLAAVASASASASADSGLGTPGSGGGSSSGGGGGGEIMVPVLPTVASEDEEDFAPTSANSRYYDDVAEGIRYLDVEGSSGAQRLPKDETLLSLDNLPPDYFEVRRASVKEHMPRLAYSCCDVLIFISQDDFSNHDAYVKEVLDAALVAASKDVHEVIKPSCILIQNKAPRRKCNASIEALTETFFRDLDPERSLLQVYREVKCMRLPDWDNSEFFEEKILTLKGLLKSMLDEQIRVRKETGLQYSFYTWSILFSIILDRFLSAKGLWISSLLQEVLNFSSPEPVRDAISFYNRVHLRDFHQKMLASLRMMACWCAWETTRKAINDDFRQNLWNPRQVELRRNTLSKMCVLFLAEMDWNRPCGATCIHEGSEIQCLQSRRTHSQGHSNDTVVAHQSNRVKRFLQRVFSEPKPVKWPGAYVPVEMDSETLTREFFLVYDKLDKAVIPEEKILLAAVEVIQGSCHLEGEFIGFTFPTYACCICMKNDAVVSIPCLHTFCSNCIAMFRHNEEPLTGSCPTVLGIYRENIRPSFCPVCLAPGSNLPISTC
ncbi:hypothetical protein Pelo_14308 [Pelomyxa schiedti]|nr:hypothetical protein Pelo_14308 [Pelomyxa schiedti]